MKAIFKNPLHEFSKFTYSEFLNSGWTNESLLAEGIYLHVSSALVVLLNTEGYYAVKKAVTKLNNGDIDQCQFDKLMAFYLRSKIYEVVHKQTKQPLRSLNRPAKTMVFSTPSHSESPFYVCREEMLNASIDYNFVKHVMIRPRLKVRFTMQSTLQEVYVVTQDQPGYANWELSLVYKDLGI